MKKTIGKTALTLVAAIVMILLVAVLMAVPAFASESDMTTQNNEQFEIVDPKYEGDANNYVTLPDAPAKDGYTFKGWSIDSSTELHHAGESIVNNDGHKLQLSQCMRQNQQPRKPHQLRSQRKKILLVRSKTLPMWQFRTQHTK